MPTGRGRYRRPGGGGGGLIMAPCQKKNLLALKKIFVKSVPAETQEGRVASHTPTHQELEVHTNWILGIICPGKGMSWGGGSRAGTGLLNECELTGKRMQRGGNPPALALPLVLPRTLHIRIAERPGQRQDAAHPPAGGAPFRAQGASNSGGQTGWRKSDIL